MNSNTHHQTSDNTFFNTPITSASIHLIINQINSLQNPTTEDFEKNNATYSTILFPFYRTTKILLMISNLNFFHIKLHFQH